MPEPGQQVRSRRTGAVVTLERRKTGADAYPLPGWWLTDGSGLADLAIEGGDWDLVAAAVRIWYTNHRGVTAVRRIVPGRLVFGSTEWHPESQWLLEAWDVDKAADRSFAMADIHEWRTEEADTDGD